jgi:hypothetical protein
VKSLTVQGVWLTLPGERRAFVRSREGCVMASRLRVALSALEPVLMAVGVVGVQPAAAAAVGPTVSMGDQSDLDRDRVNGSVLAPVLLSAPASARVVVSYFTVDGTATAGADYTRSGVVDREERRFLSGLRGVVFGAEQVKVGGVVNRRW